jgi:hypothetical protein
MADGGDPAAGDQATDLTSYRSGRIPYQRLQPALYPQALRTQVIGELDEAAKAGDAPIDRVMEK